ncbi:hypothetical protein ABZ957_28255 [Streptomyces sp. NPDC046316]|uniref:hypothetical protein n=1 Tax=unclassified Streptomyces TaxID=2593676 RepID=UPI0033DA3890
MRSTAFRPIPARPVIREEEIDPGMVVLSHFTAGAFGSLSGHWAGLCPPRCAHTSGEQRDPYDAQRRQS